jgi:hypothetical protein
MLGPEGQSRTAGTGQPAQNTWDRSPGTGHGSPHFRDCAGEAKKEHGRTNNGHEKAKAPSTNLHFFLPLPHNYGIQFQSPKLLGRHVLAVLAVLFWLYCLSCPVLAVLPRVSCPRCPVSSVLCRLSRPGCPALTVRS